MGKATGVATLKGSASAKKTMMMILEALAGTCSTTEAAERLETSLARYYQLELRALQGMMTALEPRPKGPKSTPEKVIATLEREKGVLERELRRAQSLVRAATRSVGIRSPKRTPGVKKRRRKKPRARVVLETLKSQEVDRGQAQ